MTTTEYGIDHKNRVIVGPGWASEAEVMDSFHGFGVGRAVGALVRRVDGGEWTEVRPDPERAS